MYETYFGLTERPFSIAPDPQYLFMSKRHKEAMAHLSYGLTQGGGFIVLTGEVGTGKTTLCRNLLGELPQNVDVALILNATINESELLQSVCDELSIKYTQQDTQKQLLDAINAHLLNSFSDGRHTVLIIDEAQLLSRDVLEQIRLLTNLETTKAKLLQIILIGQPELNDLLSRNDLRQLAQRITARYHLGALEKNEIESYVNFRLTVAGCKQPLFSRQALNRLHKLTDGIPRKINVLADHALLAAYSKSASLVDAKTVVQASNDVFITSEASVQREWKGKFLMACIALLILGALVAFFAFNRDKQVAEPIAQTDSAHVSLTASEGSESDKEDALQLTPETSPVPPESLNQDAVAEPAPGRVVIADVPLDDSPSIPEDLQAEFAVQEAPQVVEPSSQPPIVAPISSLLQRTLETSSDLTSRAATFRQLAELWGESLPDKLIEPVCSESLKLGLLCIGFDQWEQMLRFNRAAVLVVEQGGQLHRIIITEVDGEFVKVKVGEQLIELQADELQASWTGEGALLARVPETGMPFLAMGDAGPRVRSAREMLNASLLTVGLPLLNATSEPEVFDLDMSQKLFALQTRYEILNDSKIGNETWLLMSELVANPARPELTLRTR